MNIRALGRLAGACCRVALRLQPAATASPVTMAAFRPGRYPHTHPPSQQRATGARARVTNGRTGCTQSVLATELVTSLLRHNTYVASAKRRGGIVRTAKDSIASTGKEILQPDSEPIASALSEQNNWSLMAGISKRQTKF